MRASRWLPAAAFGETDAVLGDGEFLASARRCAAAARRSMTRDGIIKEGSGFDVRYQALGLLYAARYALLDAQAAKQRDASVLRHLLGKTLRRPADCVERVHRAARWLVSRQGVTGLLNPAGSSRYLGARPKRYAEAD